MACKNLRVLSTEGLLNSAHSQLLQQIMIIITAGGVVLDNSRCLDAQGIGAVVLSCMSRAPLIPCVFIFV